MTKLLCIYDYNILSSGDSDCVFKTRMHQYDVSLSKTLFCIASVDSAEKNVPDGNTIVKGVCSVL